MRKKIVAGNWKMNLDYQQGKELAEMVVSRIRSRDENKITILLPPFIHLGVVDLATSGYSIKTGAQNCHTQDSGAFTGEISARMLRSVGCNYCLVGHSERRKHHYESDEQLSQKMIQLLNHSIDPIFCCGEELEDRKKENHFKVIERQLELLWKLDEKNFEKIVIAYEPVWAIGTGETATAEQAQEVHAFIRALIAKNKNESIAESTSILYGGSCKPSNAKEIFSKNDVDGGLIGGASLNADDFISIVNAL